MKESPPIFFFCFAVFFIILILTIRVQAIARLAFFFPAVDVAARVQPRRQMVFFVFMRGLFWNVTKVAF